MISSKYLEVLECDKLNARWWLGERRQGLGKIQVQMVGQE